MGDSTTSAPNKMGCKACEKAASALDELKQGLSLQSKIHRALFPPPNFHDPPAFVYKTPSPIRIMPNRPVYARAHDYQTFNSPAGATKYFEVSEAEMAPYFNLQRVSDIFQAAIPRCDFPAKESIVKTKKNQSNAEYSFGLIYNAQYEWGRFNKAEGVATYVNVRLSNDSFFYNENDSVPHSKDFPDSHHGIDFGWCSIDEAKSKYFSKIKAAATAWLGTDKLFCKVMYNCLWMRLDLYFRTKDHNGSYNVHFEPGAPVQEFDDLWVEV